MALEKMDSGGAGDLLRLRMERARSSSPALFGSLASGGGSSGRFGVVAPSVGVATGSASNFGDSTDIRDDGRVPGREM